MPDSLNSLIAYPDLSSLLGSFAFSSSPQSPSTQWAFFYSENNMYYTAGAYIQEKVSGSTIDGCNEISPLAFAPSFLVKWIVMERHFGKQMVIAVLQRVLWLMEM